MKVATIRLKVFTFCLAFLFCSGAFATTTPEAITDGGANTQTVYGLSVQSDVSHEDELSNSSEVHTGAIVEATQQVIKFILR